jgi:hypothetical protein
MAEQRLGLLDPRPDGGDGVPLAVISSASGWLGMADNSVQADPKGAMAWGLFAFLMGLGFFLFYRTPAGNRFLGPLVRSRWRGLSSFKRFSVRSTPVALMIGGLLFMLVGAYYQFLR